MKKRKILYLFPLVALVLSGCTIQEGLAGAKSFIGNNIYFPVRNLLASLLGKSTVDPTNKDEQEQKPAEDQKEDEGKEDEGKETDTTNYGTAENPLTVSEAIALVDAAEENKVAKTVFVTGTVKSNTAWSTQFKNADIIITDGQKELKIFRAATFPEGFEKESLAQNALKGKTVVASGTAELFEETTYELKGPEVLSITGEDLPPAQIDNYGTEEKPLSVSEAIAVIDLEDPTKQPLYVTGKVKSNGAWNTEYKNVDIVITDGEKDFTVFRASTFPSGFDKAGITEDSLKDKIIIATGTGTLYSSTYEFKSGCEVLSIEDEADPTKTVTSIVEITKHPTEVKVGETISRFDIDITVQYSDNSEGTVHPDKVECDTSKAAESVTATVYVGELTATFNVKVVEPTSIVASGKYYIKHGDYYLSEDKGSNGQPLATTDVDKALALDFELQENTVDQYTVKSGDSFLYCIDNNNGLRIGDTECVWTIEEGIEIEGKPAGILMKTKDTGDNDRFLTLYYYNNVATDFRAYKAAATNRKENTELEAVIEKTLDSISVTPPTKTEYFVNESLDPTGMVVTAHYKWGENETEDKVLTSDQYTVAPTGPYTEAATNKEITVSFGGQEAKFTINVSEKEAELTSVTIEGTPTKTKYAIGATYSADGLVVKAHYDDNSEATVTDSAELQLSKTTAEKGDTSFTVTATYENVSSDPFVVNVEVMSTLQAAYEGAVAGDKNEFTFEGTVVSMTGTSYVLQDGEYGINIYKKETENIALGKLVEVVSTVKLYNGCPQTDSITSATVKGEGTAQTAGAITSKATLDALNHNVVAGIADAEFVSKNGDWASNATKQFVFKVGDDNLTVSFDKEGFAQAKADIANAAVAGAHYAFTGLITAAYNNNNQLTFTGTSEITKTADAPVPDPTSVTITSGASVNVGGTLDLTATVGPEGASQDVTWSIVSGSDKASLGGTNNNVLTGVAEGSVIVRATATGFESVYDEKEIAVSNVVVPTEQSVYTLTPASGSNNSYAGDCDITIGGIVWNLTGNSQQIPWRIGGGKNTGLDKVDRAVYSKDAVTSYNVTKVILETGGASGITVNSITLKIGTTAGGSEIGSIEKTANLTNTTIQFDRPEGQDWTARYFSFVFNVSVSGTSNKYVEFVGAEFYAVK